MNNIVKVVVGVMIFLGILSGVFLLFAKKKPAPTPAQKTVQATAPVNAGLFSTQQNSVDASKEDQLKKIAERKALIRAQWAQCKSKTISADTSLLWNIQITEGIPEGGTYAKGNLDNDVAYPVHVIIKTDSQDVDKIKLRLVVGKSAILKGTCTDVATDGSVVLQAF